MQQQIMMEDNKNPIKMTKTVAQLLVRCLENEGVKYVFGIPGEENIHFIDALMSSSSSIRFILDTTSSLPHLWLICTAVLLVRLVSVAQHLDQGPSIYCWGTADAFTDSTPLIALSAQVGINREYKETHQLVDLLSMFKPITKWGS